MRLTVILLDLIIIVTAVNGGKSKHYDNVPVNECNCHCNLHPDSRLRDDVKALETKLDYLIALTLNDSVPNPSLASAPRISSCNEQYEKDNSSRSRTYTVRFGSQEIDVHCHMEDFGCGPGGWTPVMKIDGTKKTFHYDSPFWSNRVDYNLAGGKTGFDHEETKLPSYWETPFSKICLGMKVGHQIKFFSINKHANSLFSLIADGNYRPTEAGRNTWKTLIGSQASLEYNCNMEGFNAVCRRDDRSKARIGILGDTGDSCVSCSSRIGFGTGGFPTDSNTCGNVAVNRPDNGDKRITAMGYILVQ